MRDHLGLYRGIVEDVADPDERGRYRVRVIGVHDDTIPVEHLPWAELMGHFGKDWGNIPHYEVDDKVFVEFEQGDKEYPVIRGGWLTAPEGVSDLHEDISADYVANRQRWVWRDRAGNKIILSEVDGERQIQLVSGDEVITISQEDGKVSVEGTDIELTATGTVTLNAEGKLTLNLNGDADIIASGNVKVDGAKIDLGDGVLGAVVTTQHICAFTGAPHPQGSSKVNAEA
jgi:hypothetical protein